MATFDKRPNGSWRAQVRRRGYKSQTRTFPTKPQAEVWARDIEANLDRGVTVDPRVLRNSTMRDILERFRDEVAGQRKGGEWEVKRINAMLRDADFVHARLDSDIAGQLRVWSKERLDDVAPDTVNRELNLISGIVTHAIKAWGLPLADNPVHRVKRPAAPARGREITWSPEDLDRLRAALPDTDPKLGRVDDFVLPALELSIETAMRLGEICSVRVADVHLDEAWLHLRDTKNGDVRDVPLSTRAVAMLRPLMALAQENGWERVIPVNKDSLGVKFRQARKRAGLGDIRFHDARHTAATRMATKLPNVLELAAVTGHRDLRSLKRYYNPRASELARKLD